jgi:hypothetical protein
MRPAAPTRLKSLTVQGPAGPLECLLQEHDDTRPSLAALVCHPHPLYGGTLHNKVVHRIASALFDLGAAVLRFNFRGVGASAGRFDQGNGELEDARAVLAFLRDYHPGARLWVAGFSFGAWIASRLAVNESDIERLVLVAPAVKTLDFSVLRTLAVPKLVVQGTHDDVAPPKLLEQEYPTWAEPKQLVWVPGASHFFDRQLSGLADALKNALADAARGTS